MIRIELKLHKKKIYNDGKSSSMVAASAYRHCKKFNLDPFLTIHNEKNPKSYDFSRKKGLIYEEILLPDYLEENANANVLEGFKNNPGLMWQAVERDSLARDRKTIKKNRTAEKDSHLMAQEILISLDNTIPLGKNIEILKNTLNSTFNQAIFDIAVHNPDGINLHAHVLMPVKKFILTHEKSILGGHFDKKINDDWVDYLNKKGLVSKLRNEFFNAVNEYKKQTGQELYEDGLRRKHYELSQVIEDEKLATMHYSIYSLMNKSRKKYRVISKKFKFSLNETKEKFKKLKSMIEEKKEEIKNHKSKENEIDIIKNPYSYVLNKILEENEREKIKIENSNRRKKRRG